jgi:hypothetical protein
MELQNMNHAVSDKPSSNLIYGVELNPKDLPFNQYFVRSGETPDQAGVAEDLGKFYISTSELPASTYTAGMRVASLFVSYDVEFETSRLPMFPQGYFYNSRNNVINNVNGAMGSTSVALTRSGLLSSTFIGPKSDSVPTQRNYLTFKDVPVGVVIECEFYWNDPTGVQVFTPTITVETANGVQLAEIYNQNGTLVSSITMVNTNSSSYYTKMAVRVVGPSTTAANTLAAGIEVAMTGSGTSASDFCTVSAQVLSYSTANVTAV